MAAMVESPTQTIVPSPSDETARRALELLADLAAAQAPQLNSGSVIGQGGMGVVRSAEQIALGRIVAVKTLRAERRHDAMAALDLLREAWVTGMIEHPNVVPVYNLTVDADGSPLIVLKRIDGVEWSTLIHDADAVARRFGTTDLLAWNLGILMQALNALRFAHHRGVIHRDLKPSNVMIGNFGEVYLLDWGIAVSLRDDRSGRFPLAAAATQFAGTPSYMAPEMLCRETDPGLSERTDVYLAGSVLFEIIAGHPPHRGVTALEVLASIVTSKPVLPPGVPAELARICQLAMADDPEWRLESVEALRLALQQYLEHRSSAEVGAHAASRTEQLLETIADPGAQRDEIYRLFGACRFGFHEALAEWRENVDASAGLARTTVAMAEYELRSGNPDLALTLLADDLLGDAAPRELIAQAQAQADAKARRAAALERLEELDGAIGRRTRTVIIAVLGVVFTILPVAMGLIGVELTHARFVEFSAGALAGMGALVYWARATLFATLFNRRLALAGLFLFASQIVVFGCAWLADSDLHATELMDVFSAFVFAAMLAIMVSPWFSIGVAFYLIALVATARWSGAFLYTIAAGNLALATGGAFGWTTGVFETGAEELASLEAVKRRRRARARSQPQAM